MVDHRCCHEELGDRHMIKYSVRTASHGGRGSHLSPSIELMNHPSLPMMSVSTPFVSGKTLLGSYRFWVDDLHTISVEAMRPLRGLVDAAAGRGGRAQTDGASLCRRGSARGWNAGTALLRAWVTDASIEPVTAVRERASSLKRPAICCPPPMQKSSNQSLKLM